MRWSAIRRSATVGAMVLGVGVGGPAGMLGAAEPPIEISRCDSTVEGERGRQVTMRPAAVEDFVVDALRPLDPLEAITPAFKKLWATQKPILIGTVLNSKSVIVGPVIAEAVIDRLNTVDPLDPVIETLEESVWSAIANACSVITQPEEKPDPAEPRSPGEEDGSGGGGDPGASPGSGEDSGSPSWNGSSGGRSGFVPGGEPGASPDVLTGGDLLMSGGPGVAPEGIAFDFSGTGSGAPQFGMLGVDPKGGQALGSARSPGSAVALPMALESEHTGRILLLAVLLAAGVGAQLLRTWILHPPGRLKIVIEPRDD